MTREEQIITEAKKHYYDDINCHNAFLHGVEWADEHPANVWHEAKEKPRAKEWFLAQIGDDAFDTFVMAMEKDKDWKHWSNGINIKRWAYIKDLLPKEVKEIDTEL